MTTTQNATRDVLWDTIVVGLGVFGSAALHASAKDGRSVLGIERFDQCHSRGSSHGHTRIYRLGYADPVYAQMSAEAIQGWKELEKESGRELLIPTGSLSIGKRTSDNMKNVRSVLDQMNVNYEILDQKGLSQRYENRFSIGEDEYAVTFQERAIAAGASIVTNVEVTSIKSLYDGRERRDGEKNIEVVTADGQRLYASSVIISPGAWLQPILRRNFNLHVCAQVLKVGYFYFPSKVRSAYHYRKFPVFVERVSEGVHCYGTPSYEFDGMVKIGGHGVFPSCVTDAESRDFIPNHENRTLCQKFIRDHFPLCDWTSPAMAETCLYTWTRNEDFILSTLPNLPHVVVGGGGSGHGFKHGPAIGRILADLAAKGESKSYSFSLEQFSIEKHLEAPAKL